MLLSLMALRDLGVGLGLDHFGTLAASPRLLQRLPLTSVKLDPGLTRDIIKDRGVRVTVKAAIALAHALGTTVLATGVENATQARHPGRSGLRRRPRPDVRGRRAT